MRRNNSFLDVFGGLVVIGGMFGSMGFFFMLLTFITISVDAFVFMKMWNWYIPEITEQFQVIRYPVAMGIILLIRFVMRAFQTNGINQQNNQIKKQKINKTEEETRNLNMEEKNKSRTTKQTLNFTPILNLFFTPFLFLFVSYLIKIWFL